MVALGLGIAIALGITPAGWSEEGAPSALERAEVDPKAQSHYEAGLAYAHQGQYERAIAEFDAAIRLAPTFSVAFQDRGSSHLALQNPVAAMADYNSAIRLSPHNSNAYFNRGNLHLQQEQYFRAIADYSTAITLTPGDAAAWQNRALAQAATGDLKNAVDGFQQAARLFQLQDNPEGYRQVLQILEYFQPDLEASDLDAAPPGPPSSPAADPDPTPNPDPTP